MPESPDPTPASKQPCERDDALAVLLRLRDAGHVAYFAGGCVRDELLGLRPKDYDVATDAPPQRVRALFPNTQAVGAAFGVILVRHRRSVVEVATFRAEGPYLDGRRPSEVHFTTADQDARRRDFTINGLFLDPVANHVIDYVGGQEDLRLRRLRAIGDPTARFEEDHLRLLRAVRFASRFDLSIDPATADAIRAHAQKLKRISPERIAEELRLMLAPPTRTAAWKLLWQLKLMQVIFRTLPEPPTDHQHDDRDALFPKLAPDEPIPFGLALAALVLCYLGANVERLGRDEIRRIIRECRTLLRISNEEADMMHGVLDLSQLLRDDPPSVASMKRFLARPFSKQSRQLLDALLKQGKSATRITWLREQFAQLDKSDVAPPPLLTGDDLTADGYAPGPPFKRVLDSVYDAQLEDKISTREQALTLARELLRR
jgi:poly(A) polymerase